MRLDDEDDGSFDYALKRFLAIDELFISVYDRRHINRWDFPVLGKRGYDMRRLVKLRLASQRELHKRDERENVAYYSCPLAPRRGPPPASSTSDA